MYAATAERVLSQIVLLSGLLAGFSFTVVGTLLLHEKSRVVPAVIVAFLASAALLLYAAIVGAITLAYPLEALTAEQFSRLARFYPFIQWPFRLGLFAFLAGIGLSGWIRSRWMGIVSTSLASVVCIGWLVWSLFLRSLFGG